MKTIPALVLSSVWIGLCWAPRVQAQMDSSSAVLLRPGSHDYSPSNLDSNRYKVRAPESRKDTPPIEDDDDEKPGTEIPSPVPKTSPRESSVKVPLGTQTGVTVPAPLPVTTTSPTAPAPPSATADVIPTERPAAEWFSLGVAPAYFYEDSSSNESAHNFHLNGPGLALDVSAWISSSWGLSAHGFTSVDGGVQDGHNMVPTTTQDFSAGVRHRQTLGSGELRWGLDYHSFSNRVASGAEQVEGSKSAGVGVVVEREWQRHHHHRTVGIEFLPRQNYNEMGTGVQVRSGAKPQSDAIALTLGGAWDLENKHEMFWKAQGLVERSEFTGTASEPDPRTGLTPSGVGVTNTVLRIELGFRWGS